MWSLVRKVRLFWVELGAQTGCCRVWSHILKPECGPSGLWGNNGGMNSWTVLTWLVQRVKILPQVFLFFFFCACGSSRWQPWHCVLSGLASISARRWEHHPGVLWLCFLRRMCVRGAEDGVSVSLLPPCYLLERHNTSPFPWRQVTAPSSTSVWDGFLTESLSVWSYWTLILKFRFLYQ